MNHRTNTFYYLLAGGITVIFGVALLVSQFTFGITEESNKDITDETSSEPQIQTVDALDLV